MLELADDHIISLFLVMGLLIVTKVRDMLDNGGILAALTVGLTVSLAGHWTWLVVLMGFLVIGSSATRWRCVCVGMSMYCEISRKKERRKIF